MSDAGIEITLFFAELLFLAVVCYSGWLIFKMKLPGKHILKFINSVAGVLFGLMISYAVFELSHWLGVSGASMHVSVSLSGLTGFQLYHQVFDIDRWAGRR